MAVLCWSVYCICRSVLSSVSSVLRSSLSYLFIFQQIMQQTYYNSVGGLPQKPSGSLDWPPRSWRLFRLSKKGSPYAITERRVPELIPVLGSQPAGDVNHKPDGRLPLLSARPAVTPATLKRAATIFAAWWTEAQWVWTVCLRLLPDSVTTAIWTRALLHLSPAR